MSIEYSKELFIFGRRLREERQRHGHSQQKLSALTVKTTLTLIKYESDKTRPDAAFLAKLARLGYDILYILTGEHSAGALSAEEDRLITEYRRMDQQGQAGILGMIAGMKAGNPAAVFYGSVGQLVQGDQHTTGNIKITVESSHKKEP